MSVNGVTSNQASVYSGYEPGKADSSTKAATETTTATPTEDTAVIYEPSKEASKETKNKIYKRDTNLINKLKADADARTQQLRNLVDQMMSKQTNAYGQANDIWKFLAKGNYNVDPATRAQAQADIAEDGYWGVNQTSDRIIDFAKALTGGNPDKIEEMRSAFKKGYQQAEKKWGGNLPDISKRTYDAVMEKFDAMAAQS